MPQWEYCYIRQLTWGSKGVESQVWVYTLQGEQVIYSQHHYNIQDDDLLGRVIAWVGLQGWEAYGEGGRPMYFKRPMQD